MPLKISIRRLVMTCFIMLGLIISTHASSFADAVNFDKSDVDKGIVKVSVNISGTTKVKMIVQKDDKKYVYDMRNNGEYDSFPLQMGNGQYTIGVYKNITDNKYAPVSSDTVNLNLSDDNVMYLQSVQNIKWTASTQAVKKADDLVKGFKEGTVKLQKVYDFVVANYKYDYDKAANVQTGYIPDVDDMYTSKKGICYDYSSMFAAMLRSHDIPTRLIKGYTVNVDGYHAWNEVYDSANNAWIVIDTTYDAQMKAYKKKVNLKKETGDYQTVYMY